MKIQIPAAQLIDFAKKGEFGDAYATIKNGAFSFKNIEVRGTLNLEFKIENHEELPTYHFDNCELDDVQCSINVNPNFEEDFQPPKSTRVVFENSFLLSFIGYIEGGRRLRSHKNTVIIINSVVNQIFLSSYSNDLYIENELPGDKIIQAIQISGSAEGSCELKGFKLLSLSITSAIAPSISLSNIDLVEFNTESRLTDLKVTNGSVIGSNLICGVKDAVFQDTTLKNLVLDGCSSLSLTRCNVGSLEFNTGRHCGDILVENCKVSNLAIGKVTVHHLIVKDSLIGRFIFCPNFGFCELISISGSAPGKTHINSLNFVNGTFQESGGKKTTMSLDGFSVSSFNFINYINNAPMNISNLLFTPWSSDVESSPMSGNFQKLDGISSVAPHWNANYQLIRIVRSDLGKINFVACDFSEMSMLFRESKITEIFLSDTYMPKHVTDDSMKRTGYSQLRKIYEGRGDSIQVVQYLAEEQNAYRNELLKNKPLTHLAELIPLSFNKWSNYYGTSWVRALLALLLWFMPLIYIIHNRALGYTLEVPWTPDEWENFRELFSLYLEFLLPVHKADFIADTVKMDVTYSSRIWDGLGRIFSAYLIYQFVQAFRKYGKK